MAAASVTTTVVQQPPPQPVDDPAPADDGGGGGGDEFDPSTQGGGAPPAAGGDQPAVPNGGAPPPAYQYSSAPRAISGGSQTQSGALSGTRKKYRDPASIAADKRSNIMHDKRVIRGNTRSAQVPTSAQKVILDEEQKKLMRRRAAAEARRKRVMEEVEKTPYDAAAAPVDGRAHMSIQTEENQLEEIQDKATEADVSTQTEDVDDKPLPPLFMPKPIGRDQQTSIEAGELFDFNLSVEPILEVLIGKTLDQALTEVLEEQELKALKAQRMWYEQQKAAELAQVQSLEAEAKRKFEEKETRLREARSRQLAEQRVAEKNAAQLMAKHFLFTLQDNTMNRLEAAGHFYDPVRRDVEHSFLPWLLEHTSAAVAARLAARQSVDALLLSAMGNAQREIDTKRRIEREAKEKAEADRLAAIAKAESDRLNAIREAAEKSERERLAAIAAEEALQKRAIEEAENAAKAKADAKAKQKAALAEQKKKRESELRKQLGALAE